jgi:hypothetical protein
MPVKLRASPRRIIRHFHEVPMIKELLLTTLAVVIGVKVAARLPF